MKMTKSSRRHGLRFLGTGVTTAVLVGTLLAGCGSSGQMAVSGVREVGGGTGTDQAAPTGNTDGTKTALGTTKGSQDEIHEQTSTVFYEVFVRSFYDSNGDGIGDLNGLTEKLDYLKDLGIGGIWLMPIQPSPSYHGYDITDYRGINSDYGTLEDMKKLVEEAHKRGIKVIMDLVINHTSVKHPWFIQASQDKNSKYRDWYIWGAYPGTFCVDRK